MCSELIKKAFNYILHGEDVNTDYPIVFVCEGDVIKVGDFEWGQEFVSLCKLFLVYFKKRWSFEY